VGPLTSGRVCSLQLLLALAREVISVPSLPGLTIASYSPIRNSLNLDVLASIFISPRNRVAKLHSQELFSLLIASYDSQGYGGVILPALTPGYRHHQFMSNTIIVMLRAIVCQTVSLVSGTQLGPMNRFLIPSESYEFVDVRQHL
jgi:hypothetical protein